MINATNATRIEHDWLNKIKTHSNLLNSELTMKLISLHTLIEFNGHKSIKGNVVKCA